MGDFNIDMLKSESCTYASRFTKLTKALMGLFIVNGIIYSDLSDHLPIVHNCNLENSKEYNNQAINDNIESDYKRIINNKNILSLMKLKTFRGIMYLLTQQFTTIYENNFPIREKSSKNKINKAKSPWMTSSTSIKRNIDKWQVNKEKKHTLQKLFNKSLQKE